MFAPLLQTFNCLSLVSIDLDNSSPFRPPRCFSTWALCLRGWFTLYWNIFNRASFLECLCHIISNPRRPKSILLTICHCQSFQTSNELTTRKICCCSNMKQTPEFSVEYKRVWEEHWREISKFSEQYGYFVSKISVCMCTSECTYKHQKSRLVWESRQESYKANSDSWRLYSLEVCFIFLILWLHR